MSISLILIGVAVFAGLVIVAGIVASFTLGESIAGNEPPPFEKKPYVFDVMSELTMYRLLCDLFGDRYYIFPQMGYSHLITLKSGTDRRHRTRFDKKSADFVLCDKDRAVARLVIELDGSSHLSEKRIKRDEKVDAWMNLIGLPILHVSPSSMDREKIRSAVEKSLAGNQQ